MSYAEVVASYAKSAEAWAREVTEKYGLRPTGRQSGTTGPGPRMLAVARYVAGHPGCSKSDAARCGESGPLYAGSVERAIRRGYVRTEQDHPTAHYRLFLTEAGEEFARAG